MAGTQPRFITAAEVAEDYEPIGGGGGVAWGGITGTLADQIDLGTALGGKQNSLGYTAENVANRNTDGTLSANSDLNYPSQKATKTYCDTRSTQSPINAQSGTYTTVAADAGKTIVTTGTFTVTIDSNANVAYPVGTVLSWICTSGVLSIAIASDTLNRGDGTVGTGTRTLAASSMATAIKTASTLWWINGKFAS